MRRLALFARRPEIGKVKTRLSPALPPAAACTLYRGMLEDALAALREARRADERFVYWAEAGSPSDRQHAAADDVDARGFDRRTGTMARIQPTGDLGSRLTSAFNELLGGPEARAVILGSDCPTLNSAMLDAALEALDRHPLVIAPSRDGGYALIGLARPAPDLFRGIAWSTRHVFEQTLSRAFDAGIDVSLLEQLEDVDTPEDLCGLCARAVTPGATVGDHTRAALEAAGFLPAMR
ncbi:MAG: TIGR04282 family arsenosugar biosynthesis glycosyltransferase [Candidatus Eisenbacteria bacterium]